MRKQGFWTTFVYPQILPMFDTYSLNKKNYRNTQSWATQIVALETQKPVSCDVPHINSARTGIAKANFGKSSSIETCDMHQNGREPTMNHVFDTAYHQPIISSISSAVAAGFGTTFFRWSSPSFKDIKTTDRCQAPIRDPVWVFFCHRHGALVVDKLPDNFSMCWGYSQKDLRCAYGWIYSPWITMVILSSGMSC